MEKQTKQNKRWDYSIWSRYLGIMLFGIFSIFTVTTAKDIWSHALIQLLLVLGTCIFTIIIPDKIIFQEYLIKTSETIVIK